VQETAGQWDPVVDRVTPVAVRIFIFYVLFVLVSKACCRGFEYTWKTPSVRTGLCQLGRDGGGIRRCGSSQMFNCL
jgi:hypothetical protein